MAVKTKRMLDRFHSKHLIPWSIVQLAKNRGEDIENIYMSNTIMEWFEKEQATNKFSEGDEVAHEENIELKMEVVEIKKETYIVNVAGKAEQRTRMKGIDCSWWV